VIYKPVSVHGDSSNAFKFNLASLCARSQLTHSFTLAQVFQSQSHPLPQLLRALAAGIILALSAIHLVPEAVYSLSGLIPLMPEKYPYNPAGACVVFGALVMVSLEAWAHHWLSASQAQAQAQSSPAQQPAGRQPVAEATEAGSYVPPVNNHASSGGGAAVRASVLVGDPHTHVCMGQTHLMLNALPKATARDQIMAFMFELGCVFHSVFIGIALGVNEEGTATVRAPS
jgi:zinc transporter 1/2/3